MDIIDKTQTLLRDLAGHIPPALHGPDRQRFIAKRLLSGLPHEDLGTMQAFMGTCLHAMREHDASDLDLGGWGAGGRIWMRIHGEKRPIDDLGRFGEDEIAILIQSQLTDAQRDALVEDRNLDFSYVLRNGDAVPLRHRADAYFDLDRLALNLRAIKQELRPFGTYRFHQAVSRVLSLEHTKDGLVLITGITGSGKSTTLDAIVEMNNRTVPAHIVIIASPVEYVHESKKCLIRHREVGRDTRSFKSGTIEALRQDPDIIVLGEIRDQFSAETAIQAALTGHKVITTFHTEDSIGGLLRLLNLNIEAFLISSTVVSIVAQRLLRRVCRSCAEPYVPTTLDFRRLSCAKDDLKGAKFVQGAGCGDCRYTGYAGRVGVFELLVLNEMVKDAILNRKTSYEIRRISVETSGLITLLEDGLLKAARGETSLSEVMRHLPKVSPPRPIAEISRLSGAPI